MSHPQIAESNGPREYIAFRISNQEFCIDIMSVREIRGWSPATTLPHAPGYVRGVINLRGAVLPIVDLAERLGFPPAEPSARHVIIVVQVGKQTVGLLVDAVSDIITESVDKIQPTPDIGSGTAKNFVRGLLAVDQRMISLLVLENIVVTHFGEAA